MERAEQTGNGQAWIELWSPKSTTGAHASEMKDMIRPQPASRYGVTKVLIDAIARPSSGPCGTSI
jgi:hypothetical protein